MRDILLLLVVGMVVAVLLAVSAGWCQGASIKVQGGDVVLTIVSAVAGLEPAPVVDGTAAQLKYKKLSTDPAQKITVSTDLASPSFVLTIEAVNACDGDSTGEVTLDATAQDLLTNVCATDWAFCDLRFTATAAASDGVGTDSHTVTYTITDQ